MAWHHIPVEQWVAYNRSNQLLMIGCELLRAKHARENGDATQEKLALERALELADLSLDDPKWKHHGLREFCRFRACIAGVYINHCEYASLDELIHYIEPFQYLPRA